MHTFDGRAAVVTGAGSGIGLAIALELAHRGTRVAMLDVDGPALARAVGEAPDELAGKLYPTVVDLLDREQFADVARHVDDELEGVDILVGNAGVAFNAKPIWETPDATIDWCVGVNLLGVIHGVKHFVPGMIARGRGGHVVSTASIGGFQVRRSEIWHQALYSATKAGVVAISEGLALDLEPHGIGVTILAPSAVATNIATSDRNRPDRFGGPTTGGQDPRVAEMLAAGMEPAAVARLTLAAIEQGDLYVFTDPRDRELVEARHRRIEAAFPH